jgi:PAS domain S-box-containing protein
MRFRRLWSLGLRDQLIILVLLVLLPALGLVVYFGLEQRQAAVEDAKQHIVGLVRIFGHEQDRLVETTRHILHTMANIPDIRDMDVAATDRILADIRGHMPFYTTLVAVRPSGEVFGCALPETKPINVADREWFDAVKKAKTFTVGRFLISRSSHKASLPMALPILDGQGRVDMVLGAALDLECYGSLYDHASLPAEASLTLADAGGTVLFRSRDGTQWVGKPLPEHLRARVQDGPDEGAFAAVGLDGVPRIYGYKRLNTGHDGEDGQSMTVIVGIPETTALAKPRSILARHMSGLVLAASFALALAWLFARRAILEPVSALIRAAARVKEGDSTARTGIRDAGREIGSLARDFDAMAEALARREQERDAAKKELEGQYAFVSALIEAAPLPIYHKERSGRYMGCNQAFADFVGRKKADIIGRMPSDFAPAAPAANNAAADEDIMAQGEIRVYEAESWRYPDGRRHVFFHKAAYRDPLGQVAGMVCVMVDITPLKDIQAQLVAAKEKAEEVSRGKSDFLASMSHEIRTPLNGVLGMLQILLTEPLDPRHRQYLETAMDAARTLLAVIGEVLDFSKIEAGRIDLTKRDFRPGALTEAVEGLFSAQMEAKGLRLTATAAPDVPPVVRGDEARLKQILFNLVGNALKFTDAGEVRVRLERAARDEKPGETVLDLVVEDTGVGIAEDAQARIFEPFRQAGASLERRRQGTGLGLAIVKRLAVAMGGDVSLHSREGEGTRFVVRVRLEQGSVQPTPTDGAGRTQTAARKGAPQPLYAPAAHPAVPPAAGERAAPASLEGLRVLVVEDDHLNRLTAVKLLERLGCAADGVSGGAEALDRLERTAYDAVLMDIQMPGMDGMETTRRIRASSRPGVSGLFVAAVTAHALKGDREVFLRAGMNAYLSKPVDIDELGAVLSQAMPGRGAS